MGQPDDLNREQQQVIAELDRHVLLVASAGTGKTSILAYRIANILEQQRATAEEILCLTFTNKACKEIRERVLMCVGEPGLGVRIKTFHGFCYDIVKDAAKRGGDVFSDFIIFDEEDCKEIIRGLNPQGYRMMNLQRFIEEVKKMCARQHLLSDDRYHDYQLAVKKLFADKQDVMKQICVTSKYDIDLEMMQELELSGADFVFQYDQALQDMHGLDFSDLIVKAYTLLQDKAKRQYWQSQFRYINVDEVQDTSELEYDVLQLIFGDSNLLLCGDYFQTIYEWRGSNPLKILDDFKMQYHPVCISFDKNYRATRTLLDASYACLRRLFPERVDAVYDHPIQAMSPDVGEPISVQAFPDMYHEAAWIYDTIQQLPVEDLSRICILTRNNRYNQDLSSYFNGFSKQGRGRKQLKFMLVDQYQFFRRQEIKDAMAFIKLLINRHDVSSMVRIVKRFASGIGDKTIEQIQSDEYRQAGVRITDYLDGNTRRYGDPFAVLLQAMEQKNVVVFDVESTGTNTSDDEIIQIAAVRLDRDGNVVDRFMHFLKNRKSVGTSALVHHLTDSWLAEYGEDPGQVLAAFLQFMDGAVLVGHNVTFDITILKSQLYRLGMDGPHYLDFYDTLDIFRRFYPGLKNHKLAYLSDYFHIANKPTHDAFDDIMATAGILLYAIRKNIVPTERQRRAYMAAHMELFRPVADALQSLHEQAVTQRPCQVLTTIVNEGGVKAYYEKDQKRMGNLRDLYRLMKELDNPQLSPMDALVDLQTYASLAKSELDAVLDKHPQIPIITVHQAKGMEFDYVFLAGMHEGMFPSFQAIRSGNFDEEKRVFYVAITRAKKQLFLSYCEGERGRVKERCRFIRALGVRS